MKQIVTSKQYEKALKKINRASTLNKLKECVNLLASGNTLPPTVHPHSLQGKQRELSAFSIDKDLRVVYHIEGDKLYLHSVGTHTEVYESLEELRRESQSCQEL